MNDEEIDRQRYYRALEKKLDAYFRAVLLKQPTEELNAELKGFLEAGMVLKITTRDVLDAVIQARYKSIKGTIQRLDS